MSGAKFDINQLINKQRNIDKIIAGEKTAVRRNHRYADVGETFILDEKKFIVEKVYQQKLADVTEKNAMEEGFSSLEKYQESLTSIHKEVVWDPNLTVWVHEFKPCDEY